MYTSRLTSPSDYLSKLTAQGHVLGAQKLPEEAVQMRNERSCKEEAVNLVAISTVSQETKEKLSFLERLKQNKQQQVDLIETTQLPDESLQIRGERALRSPQELTRLWQYILSTREDSKYAISARNAIRALVLAGYSFAGKDLSGVDISWADLSRGIFQRTKFDNANLEGVNLHLACLDNASMVKAKLTGADFGQYRLRINESQSGKGITCLQYLEALSDDFGNKGRSSKLVSFEMKFLEELFRLSNSFGMPSFQGSCLAVYGDMVAIGEKVDLSGRANSHVYVFSLSKRESLYKCEQKDKNSIKSIAFTGDGSSLISLSTFCLLDVYNAKDGIFTNIILFKYILKSELGEQYPENILTALEKNNYFTPCSAFPNYVEINLALWSSKYTDEFQKNFRNFCMEKMRIKDFALSPHPTEKLIALSNFAGNFAIINMSDMRLICIIEREKVPYSQFLMTDDGHLLILDKTSVVLIDVKTGVQVKKWTGPMPHYSSFAYSSVGKLVVAVGVESMTVWSFDQEEPIKTLNHGTSSTTKSINERESLTFSNNGELLAFGSKSEIRIWSTRDWVLRYYWSVKGQLIEIAFAKNNRQLISLCCNETPKIWNFPETTYKVLESHDDKVQKIRTTQNQLVSLSAGKLRAWDINNGGFLWGIKSQIDDFTLSKDGRYLLSCSKIKMILWDMKTRVKVKIFQGGTEQVKAGFSADQHVVIIKPKHVEIYDIHHDESTVILENQVSSLTAHAFSDDGRWLAFGTYEGHVKAWDFESNKEYTLKTHPSQITSIKFSENAIISRSADFLMLTYPLENREILLESANDVWAIHGEPKYIVSWKERYLRVFLLEEYSLKFVRQHLVDNYLRKKPLQNENVTSFQDDYGREKFWFEDEKRIYLPPSPLNSPFISAAVLHPTKPIMAIGGNNGMIQFWNVLNGRMINVLWSHTAAVTQLLFSHSGTDISLLSTSEDCTMQQWNLNEGIENATLKWRTEPHSLILNGINTHKAILDIESLIFLSDENAKTDLMLGKAWTVKHTEDYVQKPFLLPPEHESAHFSDIEVNSFNLDRAITVIFHQILDKKDPKEVRENLLALLPDLLELTPKNFHFILYTIQAVAQSIHDEKQVDPIKLRVLEFVKSSLSPKSPLFIRDVLTVALNEVTDRLNKMTFTLQYLPEEEILKGAGDIFLQASNDLQAMVCFARSLLIKPGNAELNFKTAKLFLQFDVKDTALEYLNKAYQLDPENKEIKHYLEQLNVQ